MKQNHMDLSQIAREIVEELGAQEPGRRIDIEIDSPAEAWGDAGLLKIVLHNLLGNAFKFTSTRAPAKIQFGMLSSAASPVPGGSGDGGEEKIFFVRDNGVGFDMAYANKLFGAFQRLHAMNEFPGTGIGLATVQRIVHRHGGRIWVEAEVDKGAAFFFTLQGTP
jgi:light-regulated signal transduction histidine kinase (bacteriophytochrome)